MTKKLADLKERPRCCSNDSRCTASLLVVEPRYSFTPVPPPIYVNTWWARSCASCSWSPICALPERYSCRLQHSPNNFLSKRLPSHVQAPAVILVVYSHAIRGLSAAILQMICKAIPPVKVLPPHCAIIMTRQTCKLRHACTPWCNTTKNSFILSCGEMIVAPEKITLWELSCEMDYAKSSQSPRKYFLWIFSISIFVLRRGGGGVHVTFCAFQ